MRQQESLSGPYDEMKPMKCGCQRAKYLGKRVIIISPGCPKHDQNPNVVEP
jgi:hypothetical protein